MLKKKEFEEFTDWVVQSAISSIKTSMVAVIDIDQKKLQLNRDIAFQVVLVKICEYASILQKGFQFIKNEQDRIFALHIISNINFQTLDINDNIAVCKTLSALICRPLMDQNYIDAKDEANA